MQESIILDSDGVTRRYAYDTYNGDLYVRDAETLRQSPGRPYRPIYRCKDVAKHALASAHAEMWTNPSVARRSIDHIAPRIGWRGAH